MIATGEVVYQDVSRLSIFFNNRVLVFDGVPRCVGKHPQKVVNRTSSPSVWTWYSLRFFWCGPQVLVFDVTLRSFQQMLREPEANELCRCYRKIVRRAAKQGDYT